MFREKYFFRNIVIIRLFTLKNKPSPVSLPHYRYLARNYVQKVTHNQPRSRANLAASTRLLTPSLLIASDK